MADVRPNQTGAAALSILGGLLTFLGALPLWFEYAPATGDISEFKGTDFSMGLGVIGLGILLVLAGIVLWRRGPNTGGRGWSIAILVFGLLALLVGGISVADPPEGFAQWGAADLAEAFDISEELAKVQLEELIELGDVEITAGLGVYLVAAGGAVATVAGLTGIVRANRIRRSRAEPPVTPAAGAPAT